MAAHTLRTINEMPVVLDTRVVTESGGGPDKTILNSPRFFQSRGYRMLCAYMHPPGDAGFANLRKKAEAWDAPLLSVPDRGAWDWQVITRMLQICRRERVRIWHGHDYKSNALGLLLRRFWPMHLVTTVHGWVRETARTPLYYRIDKLCLPRYESVICVSDDLLQASLACGVPADRCVLIENGIDTEQFSRRRSTADAKAALGISRDTLVVGAAGRLSKEKGFDLLIRAAHQLVKDGLDVRLLIVGEGDEKANLHTLATELGIAERVQLLGYRSDLRPVYEAMDVFALSSLREGLPNVLLEALALGVPVVSTRIAGIPRLIQHGENGLLVEPGSPAPLAQALAYLLRDREFQQRFARAGRSTIETRYCFAKRIDKIRDLYDRILSRAIVPSTEHVRIGR